MRRLLGMAAVLGIFILCAAPARTQNSGTDLEMHARWSAGNAVVGTVTLGQVNATGPDTIVATTSLSSGGASFKTVLASNSLYDVTLISSNGTQLVKFPVTTALINTANLERASINLVFNTTGGGLKSASVTVDLGF